MSAIRKNCFFLDYLRKPEVLGSNPSRLILIQKMAKTIKKLYRSKKERMIGGVAGGIANHLNTDPTIIRLI
jgi:hypothetical protein